MTPPLLVPSPVSPSAPALMVGCLDDSPALTPWMRRAELGKCFDLAGKDAAQIDELTRAQFDGSRLILEHWSQGALMTSIELRQAADGSWRAIPCSCGLVGSRSPQSAMTHVCDDLGLAFSRLPPRFELDWTQRLLWLAPWGRKKMRLS